MPLQYLVRLVSSQFILPLYTEFIYLIGLAKRADTAFDNMSVLQSHIRIYRQELGKIIAKHIETAHQKQFKPLIDNETSVSATQILMPLDKRKNYEMPKTRGPGIITDEEGQEWVPWDVISDDDNNLRDTETETKRRRERVEAVEVLRLFFLSFHSFFLVLLFFFFIVKLILFSQFSWFLNIPNERKRLQYLVFTWFSSFR